MEIAAIKGAILLDNEVKFDLSQSAPDQTYTHNLTVYNSGVEWIAATDIWLKHLQPSKREDGTDIKEPQNLPDINIRLIKNIVVAPGETRQVSALTLILCVVPTLTLTGIEGPCGD